jgi:carboxymethylenebutenolidase
VVGVVAGAGVEVRVGAVVLVVEVVSVVTVLVVVVGAADALVPVSRSVDAASRGATRERRGERMGHQRGYRPGGAARAKRLSRPCLPATTREAGAMHETTFEVGTPDGTMPIYEARPDGGGPRRGVVVVQEAFGVNDHIQSVTRRFAAAGYHAMAPHIFHRAGGGTAPYDDFEKVLPLFEGLTDDGILDDIDATVAAMANHGITAERVATVGFCFGGRVTFLVAVRRKLGAAVGFYGGGIVTARFPQFPPLIGEVPAMRTPWLGLFGDLDPSIPVDDVERLRAELGAAPVGHDVVRYAAAGHGFHCDERPEYEPDAATDAWTRTLEWLERHLAG